MANKRPSPKARLIGTIIVCLFLAIGAGAFIYYLIREQQVAVSYEKALKSFQRGNYDIAEPQLLGVIAQDPNKEQAYVCLAQIARFNGNWDLESDYWTSARNLNPLAPDYEFNLCLALAKARHFPLLFNRYTADVTMRKILKQDNMFLCLLAVFHTKKADDSLSYLQEILKRAPSLNGQPTTLLLQQIACQKNGEDVNIPLLTELTHTSDIIVAYEALSIIAATQDSNHQWKELEQTLREMTRINPFAGTQLLAAFYTRQCRFEEAANLHMSDYRHFKRPISALLLGENYLLAGKHDELALLQNTYSQGGKGGISTGDYLDALVALDTADATRLLATWPKIEHKFKTPFTNFISLYVSVLRDNPSNVITAWDTLQQQTPFYDIPQRAQKLLAGYAMKLLADNRQETAARLLNLPNAPRCYNSLLTQFTLTTALRNNTLTPELLDQALKAFPDDITVIQCAVEYLLANHRYSQALSHIEHALTLNPPPNSGLHFFHLQCLVALNRPTEAFPIFLSYLNTPVPDIGILLFFCQTCTTIRATAPLDELLTTIKAQPLSQEWQKLLPYLECERLLLSTNHEKAIATLEQCTVDDYRIQFRKAAILANFNQYSQATDIYDKLLAEPRAAHLRPLFHANLAEIYLAQQQFDIAIDHARQAQKIAPGNPDVTRCLIHVFNATHHETDIIEAVPRELLLPTAPDDIRAAWQTAAENTVRKLFAQKSFLDADNLCLRLQAYAPQSAVIREFSPKIKAELKKIAPTKTYPTPPPSADHDNEP